MRFFLFITIAEYERLTKSGELVVTREYAYEKNAMDWLTTTMREHGLTKPEDATMPHELYLLDEDDYWEYLPEDYLVCGADYQGENDYDVYFHRRSAGRYAAG